MRFKSNVLVCHNTTVAFILASWEEACKRAVSMDYDPTCTSGMDGTHSVESGHYFARALDFRVRDIDFHLRRNLQAAAQELLGPSYLVLLEQTHYHIQRNHDTFGKNMIPPITREV